MQVGRLTRSTDFERTLRTPPRERSAHFAIHHVAAPAGTPRPGLGDAKLSTTSGTSGVQPVDDLLTTTLPAASACRLGVVVPKRHARRSVTRSLLKREMRSAATRHAARLAGGLWVVRLRAPFDGAAFRSAASMALRAAVRAELETLFGRIGRRTAAAA